MELRLYNTATRRKDTFVPIDPQCVRLYVCGPTVYDLAHIGNARPIVVFDLLFRLLRRVYGEDHVVYARNITDIDDKIMARARAEGLPIQELTERTTAVFHADMAALGALEPSVEPRATDHVAEMIALIDKLISGGHAYEAQGHVLFDVSSDSHYGCLSKRSLDEMKAGARVEVAPYKDDPMDFVLWKASDAKEIGWDSPWGRGRPGWHIECSAMSAAHLGETFDIHGGGVDLIFPHHENEIAQTTCGFGTAEMARIWMHNGFVQVEGQKMSKSIGNVVTVHDLLESWPGEVVRLTLLMTHYRQPLDFTRRGLSQAQEILDGWYRAIDAVGEDGGGEPDEAATDALMDDLNTSQAIADMHAVRAEAAKGSRDAARRLKATGNLLGLLDQPSEAWFKRSAATDDLRVNVEDVIAKRDAARARRDFAEADRLRNALEKEGILLKDTPKGTVWETVKRA